MLWVQVPSLAPKRERYFVKKYGFNYLKADEKKLESLVKWCRMMKKDHPQYDFIDLMIWAYEKGQTDKKSQ
jgi:hypothetical protein